MRQPRHLRRPLLALLILVANVLSAASGAQIPTSDFVILGGGTAGCTVAGVLCKALPQATITVVERGEPRSAYVASLSSAARDIVKSWSEPALTQEFDSTPNPALNNRRMGVKLGANIGGSSAVNAARFTLPPPWYYDTLGIAGLGAQQSFALFNRVRSALQPAVPRPWLLTDYSWIWVKAAARAGLPYRANPLEDRTVAGAWPEHIAFDNVGRRVDAYRGFLKPALEGACKGRVHVVRGATVRKVKFQGNRAVSAELQFPSGGFGVASARREVLLAAGAVNTAAVLQRSGVGPSWLLGKLGIPVVKNLPVGMHLQTRHVTALTATYESALARVNNRTLLSEPWVKNKFDAGQGGPLGISPYGPAARIPGFGYLAMRAGFEDAKTVGSDGKKRLGTTSLVNPDWNSFGTVKIQSRDASVPPVLDMNLMGTKGELERSMTMTKKVREIFAQLNGPMGLKENLRWDEDPASINSVAALESKIRSNSYGTNHYCGGAAVGHVLNDRLSVKGIENLRVVDAGAIQRIPPNAGPLGTVYIVAVRAADILVEDHKDLQ